MLREILLDDSGVLRADGCGIDYNEEKRIDAARKLGEIKTDENIEWLVFHYRDDREGDYVCRYIAEALSVINTPNSIEALQRIAQDPDKHWRYYAENVLDTIEKQLIF